jgi:hypothetical protein
MDLFIVQLLHYVSLMVTLYRGPNWKIAVYGGDHGVPHFHIEGADFRGSVAIISLQLIIGNVPAPVMRSVVIWARLNQALLMRHWQELNP